MATAALPLIPRKYVKCGKVELWDVLVEGGPVKVEFNLILAREALQRDPKRFKFEMPKGMTPGPLQAEADEYARQKAEEADAEPPDPIYGRRKQE